MKRCRRLQGVSCLLVLAYLTIGSLAWAATVSTAPSVPVTPAQHSPSSQSQTLYPEAWSKLLKDGESLLKILGIIVAGVWAYFNFFRGRTYRSRLEPKISGTVSTKEGVICLIATISLKNVGLSKVGIQQEGSALEVSATEMVTDISEVQAVEWEYITISKVFKDHQWIEPGELVEEQQLFLMPKGDYLAFRLKIRIVAPKGIISRKGKEWSAFTTVTWPTERGTECIEGD